jgi:hypothetical protein
MHAAAERLAKAREQAAKAEQSAEVAAAERAALARRLQKEAEEKDEREYQERRKRALFAAKEPC